MIIYSSIYFIYLQAHVRICYGIEIECQFYNELIMIKKQILFKDYIKMPWKNGLGTTLEVDIYPAESTMAKQNYDFRISMAQVINDNEFSHFSGMRRFLTVIHGSGIKFNQNTIFPFDILHFNGDENVSSGPIISGDENLDLGVIYNPQKVVCLMNKHIFFNKEIVKIDSTYNYYFKVDEKLPFDCLFIQKEAGEINLSVEFESGTWISITIEHHAKLPS